VNLLYPEGQASDAKGRPCLQIGALPNIAAAEGTAQVRPRDGILCGQRDSVALPIPTQTTFWMVLLNPIHCAVRARAPVLLACITICAPHLPSNEP
jgi:hypothetical protein